MTTQIAAVIDQPTWSLTRAAVKFQRRHQISERSHNEWSTLTSQIVVVFLILALLIVKRRILRSF